jgi:hypothetical protein
MNVEKTIEFLLEHQARAEVRMDRFDKRFDGITKLIRMGMKAIMSTDKKVDALVASQKRTNLAMAGLVASQKRTDLAMAATDERINALLAAQQRTDRALAATDKKFERFMEAFLKKGANGRHN